MTRLTLKPPADFDLPRDACSYGYFRLWPNHWDPDTETFHRVFDLDDGPTRVAITQSEVGAPLRLAADRTLVRAEQTAVKQGVTRMFRLDEHEADIKAFHALDPRWKATGHGRVMRSPTLFEDVIKTITSCNVQWTSTIFMNRRLCEVLGRPVPSRTRNDTLPTHAFPSAAKLARTKPETLRSRCRFGYRDARTVQLAKRFAPRGATPPELNEAALDAAPDDELRDMLITLPGVGPYAAANIMQLLGRYGRLPLDSESVRHGRTVLGFDGTDAQVMRQVDAHFEPFGEHKFRSYWFELWTDYEAKTGAASTWAPEA